MYALLIYIFILLLYLCACFNGVCPLVRTHYSALFKKIHVPTHKGFSLPSSSVREMKCKLASHVYFDKGEKKDYNHQSEIPTRKRESACNIREVESLLH